MSETRRSRASGGRGGQRDAFFAALIIALGVFASPAAAQPAPSAEDVEAAYLLKFVGYVDWPPRAFAGAAAPIVVGVAGSDRMFELLSGIAAGRPAQGRPIEVKRLNKPEPGQGAHLVFVGKDAWRDLSAWAAASKDRAMVLATDAPQGVDRGAVLGFVQSGQRIRFEASLPAAEYTGVRLSARLLAVAERVVGAGP